MSDNFEATSIRVATHNQGDKNIRRTRTVATIILIILILLILAICGAAYTLLTPGGLNLGAERGGIHWIRSIYGHGTSYNDLINPTSVSFTPSGDSFWVTDSTRFRLVEYTVQGQLKTIVDADVNTNGLIFPSRIAFAPNGTIYVAEQTYNRVQVYNSNWQWQRTIEVQSPTAIAASNSMVIVGSRYGFAAYTPEGEVIGAMGAGQGGDETFDFVGSVKVDAQDNAYILDVYNNRFLKYNHEGDLLYVADMGHPGNEGILGGRDQSREDSGLANLQVPRGLALDSNGRVYIIDLFDFSVAIFDGADGSFINKVGTEGVQDGSFYNPNDIHYNPSQDIFASAEANLGRVQIFGIDGSSGNPLSGLRRQLGDFLSACCIPLLIILFIIAAYAITRMLAKKRREKELTMSLNDDLGGNDGSVVYTMADDSAQSQE